MIRLFLGCIFLFSALHAADPTGTIAGTVLDPAGAVVPTAKITVTNTQTGLSREMLSSAGGGFVFPLLPVGAYKIAVEAAGFGRYQQSGLEVAADQSITLPIRLQLGSSTQTLEVT